MKFTCERGALVQAFSKAVRFAVPKSSVQSLEGILIEAGSQIRVTGYDGKKAVRTVFAANVFESGSIVLNAKLIGEIIRKLPEEKVELQTDDRLSTVLRCGASFFRLQGLPAEDYPDLPPLEQENMLSVSESVLKNMISQTKFAISTSEARPIHTGELFEVENGTLTVVAVDGYRLALRREKVISSSAQNMKFVVPGAALTELEHMAEEKDEEVTIVVGTSHILFRVGDTELLSGRLEGEFLNYKSTVPKSARFSVETDRQLLISAVERVSLLISETFRTPVHMTMNENVIHLEVSSSLGQAQDDCFASGDGEGLEIGFNHQYLLDALRAAPTAEIRMQLSSAVSPCVIVPAGEDQSFLCMILPVRIQNQ